MTSHLSLESPKGLAQKRGQTPDPLWLESGFALPVGGQSPFLGKAAPRGRQLLPSDESLGYFRLSPWDTRS